MPQVINFSTAASIGIHSVIILAREESPLNASQLSEKIGSTKFHIGKVLQRLVKDGILSSSRGPSGGFNLNRDPSQVTLYDIYRSIEGDVEINQCPNRERICSLDMCIKENIVNELSEQFIKLFRKNTIQDFL